MTPVCRQREGFDVLLGNPPFLNQVENATTVEKGHASVARIVTGGSAVRYTDVSAMFLLLSRNLLADHGRVALVQPQSLLAAKAAGPVRTELLSDSSLVNIWISNEHLFSASVFTCAPTLLKSGPRRLALHRQHSASFISLPPLEVNMDELSQEVSRAHLTAEASGIPSVDIVSGGTLGPWIDRRRVPKVVLATQTKIIEVLVDEPGEFIASIPLITVMPNDVGRIWHIAASLASPVTCALPIPKDGPGWDHAAALLKVAHTLTNEDARAQRLLEYARASVSAFGVSAEQAARLFDWWSARFGAAAEPEEAADAE